MENLEQQSELKKLKFSNEGIMLYEDNQLILSEKLKKEGWMLGMSFQDKSNEKIVSDEIIRLKSLKYEVMGLMVRGKEYIKCLIYRDTLKK
ncbi:MAG: hypothetical protein ABH951_00215 [Patescibacteria group bacterium]